MQIVSPQQMKKIESGSPKYGISREQLMYNAGSALANVIDEYCRSEIEGDPEKKSVVFLAGSGNNGGDCFVAASRLVFRGYSVTVINLCGKPQTKIAIAAYERMPKDHVKVIKAYRSENVKAAIEAAELNYMTFSQGSDDIKAISKKDRKDLTPLEKILLEEKERVTRVMKAIESADVIADGVFGTGFHGTLDEEIAAFLAAGKNAYRFAVDVPSGGNCATGAVAEGAFKADETLTFGTLKTGMTQYPLKSYCGKIKVLSLGLPDSAYIIPENERLYSLIDRQALGDFPASRRPDAHKTQFGRVLSITGSARMRGAAALSTLAALRSGSGLVCLASPEESINTASILAPEATFLPLESDDYGFLLFDANKKLIQQELERADAVLIGCGMGVTPDTIAMTRFVIENAKCPVIIDADGINCIASDIDMLLKKQTDIVLTPHIGEMARLLGCENAEVTQNRFASAEGFAEKYGVTVLLKGAGTLVADSHYTAVNSTGNPGMSRGGSGDVLSGIVVSFLAQGYDAFDAAGYAAYVHGLAGDITAESHTQTAMLPSDFVNALPDAFMFIKENEV